ncbi:MAG: cupin domain-containing protein [candidate division Zixibacteria bacterium]|nr:cupin domain-containing protein [candidate division Zixibacteria bacterium]
MNSLTEKWDNTIYPDMIRNLPEIDININGIRGWLLQDGKKQAVFFDIQPVGKVPPHTHCAQWGIMLEGEMSLTIGDDIKVYRKGDQYYIPEGVVHSANFLSRVNVIDVFDAPDRYNVK